MNKLVATSLMGVAFTFAMAGCAGGDPSDTASIVLAVKQNRTDLPERAWINSGEECFLIKDLEAGSSPGAINFYVIGAVDPDHPQDVDLGSDCVTHGRTAGSGNRTNIVGLFPGPNATPSNVATRYAFGIGADLVYAVDLGNGLQDLTEADLADQAVALGLATPVDFNLTGHLHQDQHCKYAETEEDHEH